MSSPAAEIIIIKKRYQSFLIWQTLQSSLLFLLTSPFLFPPSFFLPLFSLLPFLLSSFLFSLSLHSLSSPSSSSPSHLGLVWTTIRLGLLLSGAAFSGFAGLVSVGWSSCCSVLSFRGLVSVFGFRGFISGLVYGLHFVFRKRFVLAFPIVQRPPFFSYKMGIPSAVKQALEFSLVSFLFSGVIVLFLPYQYKGHKSMGFITEQFILYIGSFAVILSWELILHLHKVLHTKRFVFASSKGSGFIETNPSEPLLAALEDSPSRSLLHYLAYLDLNMICASNIDPWRRAAFFEETGETYKRVVTVCLRPLEQLTSKIAQGLAGSADNINKLSHQLRVPNDIYQGPEILELFSDFQLYAWCAQAIASLEVRSHKEDNFGVAQLSRSHATVLSTLLACLLSVESFMGKKINLQSPNHILGHAGIKWATNSTTRREIATAMSKKQGSHLHSRSYALADVLKVSIYAIVSEFHEDMLASAKQGHLEKDWVTSSKPVYGSVELLVQKLHFFLNFQAS